MTSIRIQKQREHWFQQGFKNLLVWFFVYLVIGPFLETVPYAEKILDLFLTVLLVSALAAMSESRKLMTVASGILLASVVLIWLRSSDVFAPKLDVSNMMLAAFLTLLAYSFSKYLFRIREVTPNAVCAALCLYLVVGMLWGALYAVLESIVPGSFSGSILTDAGSLRDKAHHLQYFSYVTLSTLGYGDITPQTRGAAALCQTEAILGQFLTVALVARLVGIQVAQETTRSS
mgnify:CR=1 FL=1